MVLKNATFFPRVAAWSVRTVSQVQMSQLTLHMLTVRHQYAACCELLVTLAAVAIVRRIIYFYCSQGNAAEAAQSSLCLV